MYHLSVGACTDGLFPRAAGLNQLQFKMKAGGGGGARPRKDISSLLSNVQSVQPPASLQAGTHAPNLPPHPPSLSLCPDTSPHAGMYKKRLNNPWQARPETPSLNQAAGFH